MIADYVGIHGLALCVSVATHQENRSLMAMTIGLIIEVFGGYCPPPLSTIKLWHLEWLWRLCPGVITTSFA